MTTATIRLTVDSAFAHLFTPPHFIQTDVSNVFTYATSNRYIGDDETVVFSLWGDIPEGVTSENWEINWGNSTY